MGMSHRVCDWKKLLEGLRSSSTIFVDRHVFQSTGEVKSLEIDGFCDSSGLVYGCAIYVRIVTDSSTYVKLWTAKSRLAPMKEQSIPRLELLSCLLLAKLVDSLLKATKGVVSFDRIVCWSDWKPFIENRVTKIRKLVDLFL